MAASSPVLPNPEADPNLAALPRPLWLLPRGIISTHYGPCIIDQSSGHCGSRTAAGFGSASGLLAAAEEEEGQRLDAPA